MTLFEKNVAAIRPKDARLAEILASLPKSPRIGREVNSTGEVMLKVKGTDGSASMSLHNSEMALLDSLAHDLAKARMVALLGFGSGELFAEVVRRTNEQTFILLIEPDIDLFAAMLREIDFSETLGGMRVSLAIAERAQAATFIRAEKEYGVFMLKDFTIIENRWSAPLYRSYFDETKRKLRELKDFGLQNIYTVSNLAGLWQKNIFKNIPFILKNRPVLDLFEKFIGVPAVVVSAGPSLDKTVFQLTVLKSRGIIIAVDTAVRTLLEAGVTPDIVVSLDAKYENYLHLKGISLPETLFVLNPSVHPMIAEEHVGPMVFCHYAEPLFIWLQKVIGDRGNVRAGGSVATSAFDLAVKMGCSPVILTGQDMAYTGGQSHSGGTVQETMRNGAKLDFDEDAIGNLDDPSLSDLFRSKDIFGRLIVTTFKMDSWRQWYELIIERESPLALNATEGGLYINGMRHLSMAESITQALAKEKKITQITADSKMEKKIETATVVEALTKARDEARTVKNVCGKGMVTAKSALDSAKNLPGEAFGGENELKEMDELSREILSQEIFAQTNRWRVEMTLDKIDQIGRGNGDEGDKKTMAEGFLVLFSDLYSIASDFEKSVSGALKNLKSYKLESMESLK